MYRILVIDDEEEVRHALQRRLQREGYQVDVAEGESDGIEKIKQASPAYDWSSPIWRWRTPTAGCAFWKPRWHTICSAR